MSQLDNNPTEKSLYKDDYCNAFGCYNNATEIINVSAGRFGKITLHVCKCCISKFQNKEDPQCH